ncbi:MAG: CDP-alcohol phosphatidyltransferase family protein [Nitrospira sp.]|nr:CDP-alcohol phosphatidyltransferase family protein [Nitrospira sp.]
MASIYQLKPAFQNLLRPVTNGLAGAGITANQVTLAALILSCLVGGAIAWQPQNYSLLLLLPLALFVRMALNAIDGMLAREHHMQSRLGAILNELGDVASDTALYLPLALVPEFDSRLIVLLVVLGLMVEMTGVIAVQIGAARNYAGPMGKSDRAFLFGLVALLSGSGIEPGLWSTALFASGSLLSAVTIINRARQALAEAR